MEIISVLNKQSGSVLDEGYHIVTINELEEVDPSQAGFMPWKDKVKQLEVKMDNDEGYVTHWFNTKGFLRRGDKGVPRDAEFHSSSDENKEEYACVLKRGKLSRLISEDRTQTCADFLGKFANAAGTPEGAKINTDTLKTKEVGVLIKANKDGFKFVDKFYSVEEVEELIAAEQEEMI